MNRLKVKGVQKWDSLQLVINFTRWCGISILMIYWVMHLGHASGILLILVVAIFSILRQFWPKSQMILLIESLFIGAYSVLFPEFVLAHGFSLFESSLVKKQHIVIPGLIISLLRWPWSLSGVVIILIGGFLGVILRIACDQRDYYQQASDIERRKRYELEITHQDLLEFQDAVQHMSVLEERNRIAQQLHDAVGHELTGAVLGLQVLESMVAQEQLSDATRAMLGQVKIKVNSSAKVLRETVHQMKPYVPLGLDDLKRIIESFVGLPIEFQVYGHTDYVPIQYWIVLKAVLMEGLTNVVRHGKDSKVAIQLDITATLVRLSIINDGVVQDSDQDAGMGLRNLSQRAKIYRGHLTTTILKETNEFRLVLVLPLKQEVASDTNN